MCDDSNLLPLKGRIRVAETLYFNQRLSLTYRSARIEAALAEEEADLSKLSVSDEEDL